MNYNDFNRRLDFKKFKEKYLTNINDANDESKPKNYSINDSSLGGEGGERERERESNESLDCKTRFWINLFFFSNYL